jgi:transglutaminase-like putative cysteine protease
VTLVSASQLPDQNGQQLAWSLGTIQGFDRASVALTVSLPSTIPLQLDSGAEAFATLNAGPVSNSTPAATLLPGSIDPNLLAPTPDANTADPYVQEEAAKLDYNPQNIFNFLHDDVGYNSYTGSLRGARGTLWSSAGNALDVASLGVALLRASGIPAQYVSGTLSQSQAQQLILSMFPVSYQTVGYVPSGTQTANPADDFQLQTETQSHYWFEFDTGSGWVNADPLLPGARVGQTFTAATGSFTEVPESLRQTTEVSVTAEIYSQAAATIGLNPLQANVVLDQTFNDVDLVGHPLSIGNFVRRSGIGAIFTDVTNTYTWPFANSEAVRQRDSPSFSGFVPFQ